MHDMKTQHEEDPNILYLKENFYIPYSKKILQLLGHRLPESWFCLGSTGSDRSATCKGCKKVFNISQSMDGVIIYGVTRADLDPTSIAWQKDMSTKYKKSIITALSPDKFYKDYSYNKLIARLRREESEPFVPTLRSDVENIPKEMSQHIPKHFLCERMMAWF